MRTKDEAIKMFNEQANKSAEQIINWYKEELSEDKYSSMTVAHDGESSFECYKGRMNGKMFFIEAKPHTELPNTYVVRLFKTINKQEILKIIQVTRL